MLLAPDQQHPDLLNDLSNERQVTADTPPTFLFHTDADTGVPAENSVDVLPGAAQGEGAGGAAHLRAGPARRRPRRHRSRRSSTWPDRLAGWLRTRAGCSRAAPALNAAGAGPARRSLAPGEWRPPIVALSGPCYPVHNGAGRTLMESVMDMQWWHWAVLGLVLGLLELATPGGFFILFFGVGALLGRPAARCSASAVRCGCSGCCSRSSRSSPSSSSAIRCCAACAPRSPPAPIDSLTRRRRGRQGGHPARRGRPRRAARHGLERAQRRPRRRCTGASAARCARWTG